MSGFSSGPIGTGSRQRWTTRGGGSNWGATLGGLGLTTMRERAATLSGKLEVKCGPGEGTRVLYGTPIPS